MSKTLAIYLMSGPDTPELAEAAVEGGADLVELGFPFSDPLADGPVIRRAAEKALAQGMRTQACLECLAATRERVDVPLVPMTYASLLEAYGWERFAADAALGRRRQPDRRRPPGRRAARAAAGPARRADLDRRAAAARGRADGRLALPRHRHRHDRCARRASTALAGSPSAPRAAAPACRSTQASGSRRRRMPVPPPSSPTASSSARARSKPPREAPPRCASTCARSATRSTDASALTRNGESSAPHRGRRARGSGIQPPSIWSRLAQSSHVQGCTCSSRCKGDTWERSSRWLRPSVSGSCSAPLFRGIAAIAPGAGFAADWSSGVKAPTADWSSGAPRRTPTGRRASVRPRPTGLEQALAEGRLVVEQGRSEGRLELSLPGERTPLAPTPPNGGAPTPRYDVHGGTSDGVPSSRLLPIVGVGVGAVVPVP